MKNTIASMLVLVSSLWLSACGGNSSSAATTGPSPLGVYSGTTSNGSNFLLMLLPDGVAWGMHGYLVDGLLYLEGFAEGTGYTHERDKLYANFEDYSADGSVAGATLQGTFTPQQSISGTLTVDAFEASFTTTAIPSSAYNFDQVADLGQVMGDWSGTTMTDHPGDLQIGASGDMIGTLGGCSVTGRLTPSASGKNAFNLSLALGPESACVSPGRSALGIALAYPLDNGMMQLALAYTTSKTVYPPLGSAFIAQRPQT